LLQYFLFLLHNYL